MTLVTPQQSSPGDTIEASDINTPVNQLAAVINGNVDSNNLANGAVTVTKIASGATLPTVMQNPYKFLAYRNTTLTTSSTPIAFDTKLFDTGTNYDTTTGKFTAPVAGFYVFSAQVSLTYASTGDGIGITVLKNGASYINLGIIVTTYNSSFTEESGGTTPPISLAANDYIQILSNEQGGKTINIGAAPLQTFFGGYLLSAT